MKSALEALLQQQEAIDEAVEKVGEGEQPQRVPRRRRVDHHALKVQPVRIRFGEGHDLDERDELVDAGGDCVEDVGKVA